MNNHVNDFSSDEVISLYDIWKKLVEYKKIFWIIFFTVFIIGSLMVFLTPPKYIFSQVIEVGKSPDEKGVNTINIRFDEVVKKIKKVFLPAAVRAYNSQTDKKIYLGERNLVAENAGNDALILSVNGPLENFDIYKFIFQKIIKDFSNDTKEYIEYRQKTLADAKVNLEHRLAELDQFYKTMSVKYFADISQKNSSDVIGNKIISMYLNDQNSLMIQLSNNISVLQAQIMGTYNTKVITDVIVSDEPVGSSKSVLLVLAAMAASFFAFFGVFVISCYKKFKNFK